MQKNPFSEEKNSFLEELFLNQLLLWYRFFFSIDNFEQKEMKKIRPIKKLVWLVNYYVLYPIRKNVGGAKEKIVNLFKTNTPKQAVYGRGKEQKKFR